MFSKSCEYGIRAMIYLCNAQSESEKIGLREIAKNIESPTAFTAKILQKLSKCDFLGSVRGPHGGFYLLKSPGQINLATIVKAIDGEKLFKGCSLGLKECDSSRPCPLHFEFVAVRDSLAKMLHSTSLKQLKDGVENGSTFLVH